MNTLFFSDRMSLRGLANLQKNAHVSKPVS